MGGGWMTRERVWAVVVPVLAIVVGVGAVRSTFREMKRGQRDVAALEQRLAAKRAIIRRQQAEMEVVATAVDRLVKATVGSRTRTSEALRLGQIDGEEGDTLAEPRVRPAGVEQVTSEEAQRTIAQLGWLEEQTTDLGESVGALAALLRSSVVRDRWTPSAWPVAGAVNSPYGMRQSPWGGGIKMHTGIDIQAAFGSPVRSAGRGEVVFAGREGGYGSMVVVDHGGGVKTLYAHLSAVWIEEGQPVEQGTALGAVGQSGRATGPHLHYEVRVGGEAVDPQGYLGHTAPRPAFVATR